MPYFEAQPPSSYVPPNEKFVFRRLLANIHNHDMRHGQNTPSSTLLFILAAARELGIDPAELVGNGAGR